MPVLNFKPQFREHIESGRKRHTIRAKRKFPCKPGQILYLYTGLRKKGAALIGRYPCVKVEEIEIFTIGGSTHPVIRIDGQTLDRSELERLAFFDGFLNYMEMMRFWDGRLPFQGHVIHWDFEHPVAAKVKRHRKTVPLGHSQGTNAAP